MNWLNKRTLITGAGGFIGSHLADALLLKGANVRAFVRYNSRDHWGWLESYKSKPCERLEIVRGDIRDPSAVATAVKDIEIVFHLAAHIAIPYSYINPREVIDTNVTGTVNVLEAARAFRVKHVVHTSTSEVYGTARTVPISEAHPLQGQSPYSASKIGADKIVESYHRSFSIPVTTVRPFNTYGPRQSARAIIPTVITQALKGGEVKVGNTLPTRDFTFVSDTVNGFIMAAESEAGIGQEINLGFGSEISISELIDLIVTVVGRKVVVRRDNSRIRPINSEVERLLSDNRRAAEVIGWRPTVSLEEGIGRTVDWVRENLGEFQVGSYKI